MSTMSEDFGSGRSAIAGTAGQAVGLFRLAVGLAQGVGLYLLLRLTEGEAGWSRAHPGVFAPFLLIALFVPPMVLAGAGKMRWLTLGMWAVIAASALALLGWHDVARQIGTSGREPTPVMFAFAAAILFIAHHLILTADRARRPVAPYPAYFDAAWMAGVQLAASVAFTGAFCLLLFLGAALFNVIGLNFLGDLLQKGWFSLPLTGLAFATAVQLTDVRESLIRGVRSIALMLLSWLLLVLTVLVAAFLAALPFTGLSGLWETGSATGLLLGTTGALIILINAAYQDGRDDNLPPRVLQIAVRAASVLLIPLVGLAVWGLALRIGQHGLTSDRIIACACALVGAIYAAGYAWAGVRTFWRPGDWMKPLEPTNLIAAVAAVLAVMALFSPVADPARLSVADQVARLERGAVAPDAFDYDFLWQRSGKAGRAALETLTTSTNSLIAEKARAAKVDLQPASLPSPDFKPVIGVLPGAPALPAPFFQVVGPIDARSACRAEGDCVAALGPSLGFPDGDILLVRADAVTLFSEDAEYGTFWPRGGFTPVVCEGAEAVDARALLRQGRLKATENSRPALETGSGVAAELVAIGPPEC